MLSRGEAEADLSETLLTVREERREVIKFSYPTHVTDITFMTDKPKSNPKRFAIFDAFALEVWIGIGLFVILMSLLLCILLKRRATYSTLLFETIGKILLFRRKAKTYCRPHATRSETEYSTKLQSDRTGQNCLHRNATQFSSPNTFHQNAT